MGKNKPKASSSTVSLGKSLIHTRFPGKHLTKKNEIELHSTNIIENSSASTPYWQQALQSVTEMSNLDEFVYNAQLASLDFTAEKINTKILLLSSTNNNNVINQVDTAKGDDHSLTLSLSKEQRLKEKISLNRERLRIPRRPIWLSNESAEQFDLREREAFLAWRREFAKLEEASAESVDSIDDSLHFTPYEKNIEIWRQLWRVMDKSNLLVQIVDGRNPLLYYCEDLPKYFAELSATQDNRFGDVKRCSILLINKADLLSLDQRLAWCCYFEKIGVEFYFYSAVLALEEAKQNESSSNSIQSSLQSNNSSIGSDNCKARILSKEELTVILLDRCPSTDTISCTSTPNTGQKFVGQRPYKKAIGMVGYPNVGKSSTINSLFDKKKVSVGATPGKTKHFQTLWLTEDAMLCDCPGLVFPNFTTSKAELVVNGILPIDQSRDFVTPASLVAQRIPRQLLEFTYGIFIARPTEGEHQERPPTGSELLSAYALMRGFRTGVYGAPDESRAARHILKDYVNGKLLFVHPPPSSEKNPAEFNREIHDKRATDLNIRIGEIGDKKLQAKIAFQKQQQLKEGGSAGIDNEFFRPIGSSIHSNAYIKGRAGNSFSSSSTTPFTRLMRCYSQQQSAQDERQTKNGKEHKKHFNKK